MTAVQRRRAVASSVSGAELPNHQGGQLQLAWWVSQDAVRQVIGAWAATARAGRSRPTTELIRGAVGVACAIAELAAVAPRDADTLPLHTRGSASRTEDTFRVALTRPVAYDPAQLGELSGVGPREVERALDLLRQAGAVLQLHGERGALVLNVDCLAPAPAVAAVAWRTVRDRLASVGAPIAAPSATLRALAERLGDVDVSGGGGPLPAIRLSVRDLELVTEFGRSTVSEAIAALVRARLLDVDARAGHTGRFVIRPAAFGLPDEAPVAPEANPARALMSGAASFAERAPRAAPHGARTSPPASVVGGTGASAPVLIGTFAGTPIYAPPGTPLVVECDADGRWSCQVGPYLRLGPIANP